MDAIFALDRAKNFDQFRAAAKNFEVPSQNLIYADTAGHIGYQSPGRIPQRGKGDGTLPAPGWDSSYRWKGYIPFEQLPYEYDPERGYIVTANQAVIDSATYPDLLTKDWGYGSRSQRINDLIESKIKDGGKISPDDMRTMQTDNRSEIATLLNPLLLKIDISDPYVREAQKLLEGWDYTQEPDSAAAAYFNAVWRNVLKLSFGDKLPKELRAEGDCINVRPADATGPVDEQNKLVRECGQRDPESAQPDGGDRWYEVVRPLLKQEKSEWWVTPGNRTDQATETRDQLLARAMKDARWELTAKLGKDVSTWSWGRPAPADPEEPDPRHRRTRRRAAAPQPRPVEPGRRRGGRRRHRLERGRMGYEVIWVPSMRMVVNVGDWDKSRWINLTGASGHAFHSNYTDQTDAWAKGDLYDWAYGKAAVDAATKDTLTLKP